MTRCAICGDSLDPEHPDTIYGLNPLTFRRAWLHWWCATVAYEALEDEPASGPQYASRRDEYDQKVAD